MILILICYGLALRDLLGHFLDLKVFDFLSLCIVLNPLSLNVFKVEKHSSRYRCKCLVKLGVSVKFSYDFQNYLYRCVCEEYVLGSYVNHQV